MIDKIENTIKDSSPVEFIVRYEDKKKPLEDELDKNEIEEETIDKK